MKASIWLGIIWFAAGKFLYAQIGSDEVGTGAFKRMQVAVGGSIELAAQEGANLTVSRKGVVELQPLEKGLWRVIGLKRGFVKISWVNEETEKEESYFVAVGIGAQRNLPGKDGLNWQTMCATPGIKCSEENSFIDGEVNGFPIWLGAKGLCGEKAGCLFFLKLSNAAKQQLEQWLGAVLGSGFEFVTVENRLEYIYAPCRKVPDSELFERASSVTQGVAGGTIPLRCRQQGNVEIFQLHAKILQLEKSITEDWGVDSKINNRSQLVLPEKNPSFSAIVKALRMENNAKIIAEPTLILSHGQKATLASGGEFQVTYESVDTKSGKKEGWKKIGLELEATAERYDVQNIKLDISMWLRNRISMLRNELTVSSIASVVNLRPDTPTLIGTATTKSEGSSVSSFLGIEYLPILGPLFRSTNADAANLQICLWASIGLLR